MKRTIHPFLPFLLCLPLLSTTGAVAQEPQSPADDAGAETAPETPAVELEGLPSADAAADLIARVMARVADGETRAGLELLRPHSIIAPEELTELIDQLVEGAPALEQSFGAAVGVEPLGRQTAGESLLSIAYLQKFEKHVLRWRFFFYRPDDVWLLSTLRTDIGLEDIFASPTS